MSTDRASRRNTFRRQRKLARVWATPKPEWHQYCLKAPPSQKPKRKPISMEGAIKALFK